MDYKPGYATDGLDEITAIENLILEVKNGGGPISNALGIEYKGLTDMQRYNIAEYARFIADARWERETSDEAICGDNRYVKVVDGIREGIDVEQNANITVDRKEISL